MEGVIPIVNIYSENFLKDIWVITMYSDEKGGPDSIKNTIQKFANCVMENFAKLEYLYDEGDEEIIG